MIKATLETPDKRKLLLVGLSFANLERFRAHPGDTHIRIDGKELGLPVDVMIFSGETEEDCVRSIETSIGPATTVLTGPRMSS